MKFLYGLAFALIIFKGLISQCEGAGGPKESWTSLDLRNLLQDLPINVYEEILSRTGFNATEQAAKDGERTSIAIKHIFDSRIIHIVPVMSPELIMEGERSGDITLAIIGANRILSLFEKFGSLVKRIKVNYVYIEKLNHDIRCQIIENIFVKYAEQFTSLDIIADSLMDFLNEISVGRQKEISFPNVTKLGFRGQYFTNSYNFNSIFPNLESLTLYLTDYYIAPLFISPLIMRTKLNRIKNVRKLKELKLLINPESYKLPELESLLKKNKQLSSFAVVLKDKIDILHSIEVHMKTVEILEIYINGTEFLNNVSGKHQFKMPKLKKLILRGESIIGDPRIIYFINNFKNCEKLGEMVVTIDFFILSMAKLIEFQELINLNMTKLKKALEISGRKKKLNIKMWLNGNTKICNTFKTKVIEFNEELKQSHKLTWKIESYENNLDLTMMFVLSE